MFPGLTAGVTRYRGAGGALLVLSGTAMEDETLTASGGVPPYAWTLVSDGTALGTGVTLASIPALAVGEAIRLTDSTARTVDTATVGSSAISWMSAADYDGTTLTDRGTLGAADLTNNAAAPTHGTDALGPYIDFTSGNGLKSGAGATLTTVPTDVTAYFLNDSKTGMITGFVGEMYQSGDRVALREHSGGTRALLDLSYRTYKNWITAPDSCALSTFVMDGARSLATRYGYRDQTESLDSGVYWNPRVFDGTITLGFGGLNSGGTTPYRSKVRFIAFYPGKHSAAKRAEVRAALARQWPHVDQSVADFAGLVSDYDAGNVTTSGSDVTVLLDGQAVGNDLPSVGTNHGTLVTDPNQFNGKPFVQTDAADDASYELGTATFDWGADFTLFAAVIFGSIVERTNGGYLWSNYAVTGGIYPFISETPTSFGVLPEAAATKSNITSPTYDYPMAVIASSDAVNTTMYGNGLSDAVATAGSPANHAQLARFRLMGNGTNGGSYKMARAFFFRRGLTPTEVLLAQAEAFAEYGAGSQPFFDVDARDAVETSGEVTSLPERGQVGEVFAPDSGGTGPDYVADHFGTGMHGMLYETTLKSLVVEGVDTVTINDAKQWTFFVVCDSDNVDDDSRILRPASALLLNDAHTTDYKLTLYDGAWRESSVVGTAGKQVFAVRTGQLVHDFFRNGAHQSQVVTTKTAHDWDSDGVGIGLGGDYIPTISKMFRGHLGKVMAYQYAMGDEEIIAKMQELNDEWSIY